MNTIFRKYATLEQAEELCILLKGHKIEPELVVNDTAVLDANFLGSPVINRYEIKIAAHDFERAEKIMAVHAGNVIQSISEDYHLHTFSDEELHEILTHADEWSEYDYQLAQTILEQRGKPVLPEQLELLQKQRLTELSQPASKQNGWIIVGYVTAVLGGILGFFVGYHLWTSRKTLPNGEQVYVYQEADRLQGKTIFILSAVFSGCWLLYRVSKMLW